MMVMVNMGTVWDRATEFLSDNLSAVVPIALLAIFVPLSLQANLEPIGKSGPGAALLVNIVSILVSVITMWGQLAITALAIEPDAGRTGAVSVANRRLLPMVLVSLLLFVAVIVAILPIAIALALGGFDYTAAMNGSEPQIPPGTGLFVALYTLVMLIVGLWAAARLMLINPVIAGERGMIRAIARSFVLTRGITWKIIGVVVLFGIVALVAILAAQSVFGSILELIAGGEGDISVATVLTSIAVGAVMTGFAVLASAFTAKLYVAVRDVPQAIVDPA